MWARRFHLLQPLTGITPDKVIFKWAAVEHKSFEDIKQLFCAQHLIVISGYQ